MLVGSAHLIRVDGGAGVLLMRRYVTVATVARPLWRLRRYQSFPLLKRVECAGPINAWRSPNELDHLLKLGGAELRHNLVDASLMEQQISRDNGFGHALNSGPAHILQMKKYFEAIRHEKEYNSRQCRAISPSCASTWRYVGGF